jgi:hypothetical protein
VFQVPLANSQFVNSRALACSWKSIAYLGKEVAGELIAGTAFLTLSGQARQELQERIERLVTERPATTDLAQAAMAEAGTAGASEPLSWW